jgi:hypothetical protein
MEHGCFENISLSSDVREKVDLLFQFLLGIRLSTANFINRENPESHYRLGLRDADFYPVDPMMLILTTEQFLLGEVCRRNAEEQVSEWLEKGFSFSDEDDQKQLRKIFKKNETQVLPLVNNFSVLLSKLDLVNEDRLGTDDWRQDVANVLNWWTTTDAGAIYRLNRELEGLENSYSDFWPEIAQLINNVDISDFTARPRIESGNALVKGNAA